MNTCMKARYYLLRIMCRQAIFSSLIFHYKAILLYLYSYLVLLHCQSYQTPTHHFENVLHLSRVKPSKRHFQLLANCCVNTLFLLFFFWKLNLRITKWDHHLKIVEQSCGFSFFSNLLLCGSTKINQSGKQESVSCFMCFQTSKQEQSASLLLSKLCNKKQTYKGSLL